VEINSNYGIDILFIIFKCNRRDQQGKPAWKYVTNLPEPISLQALVLLPLPPQITGYQEVNRNLCCCTLKLLSEAKLAVRTCGKGDEGSVAVGDPYRKVGKAEVVVARECGDGKWEMRGRGVRRKAVNRSINSQIYILINN
jgi:hypothetical protein